MAANAVVRHVRMSPRKMRIIANMVRGKRVDEAMGLLKRLDRIIAYIETPPSPPIELQRM